MYQPRGSSGVTGGGTVATGGFTLTVPATGTAALLNVANVFTAKQTLTSDTPLQLMSATDGTGPQFLRVSTNVWGVSTGAGTENFQWALNNAGFAVNSNFAIGTSYASRDVILARDAAAVLALKNSTNPQTFRVYGTTTGSKYLNLTHDGTNALITASSGSVLISNLPTANPGPGILWNNAGTPAIGT